MTDVRYEASRLRSQRRCCQSRHLALIGIDIRHLALTIRRRDQPALRPPGDPRRDDRARRRVDLGKREMFGAAEAAALDQDPAGPALLGGEVPASAASPAARRRAARSLTRPRSSCGMRAAGVPGRGENGKTCRWVSPHSSTIAQRVREHRLGLGREAGDEIGAEHDVRPQPPHAFRRSAIASAREWRRFMRFRIRSSP